MIFYLRHCEGELFTSPNLGPSTLPPESPTAFDFATNKLRGPTSATSTASTCGA